MNEYHKIQTIFKRDPATKYKTLLMGEWSIPEFGYLAENQWAFTEKVDGTCIRVMYKDKKVTFGGKTDRAQVPAQLMERLIDRFYTEGEVFEALFGDAEVCLYGEGYGPKIQKGGGNYREDQDFVLFDIKIGEHWLQRKDVEDIAGKLGVDVVPVIGTGTLQDMIVIVRNGIISRWGDFKAEGIVARPATELFTRNGSRILTKLKLVDFS